MAWNGPHHNTDNQFPPWDFFDPSQGQPGAGVDHAAATAPPNWGGFPFGGGEGGPFWTHRGGRGGWGWGGRGRHGPHGRHHHGRHGSGDEEVPTDGEEGEDTPMMGEKDMPTEKAGATPETETLRADSEHPDPPESVPLPHRPHPHGWGRRGHGRRGGGCARGGPGMRGHGHHHFGPPPHFGPHGHHGHGHGHGHGPGSFGGGWPGFGPMMAAFAQHPFAQGLRNAMRGGEGENDNNGSDIESFAPPVDTFQVPEQGGWVVHVSLPGAKKEDVGVHWDGVRGVLSVSGVVYRPGDEAFLKGLVSGERKVGLFRREVKLPPPGAEAATKDEVDGTGISARMEDGVLVVTVPVVEREWTEVHKVDVM